MTFETAQHEKSKRSGKHRIKSNSEVEKSKFSGKHSFNGMIVCGDCKSEYQRKVWRKRDGTRQPVWRCVSRLKHGTKYCTDSVTLDEESLQTAIAENIRSTQSERHQIMETFAKQLQKTIDVGTINSGDNADALRKRIEELTAKTMAYVADSSEEELHLHLDKMREMSDEIKKLNELLNASKHNEYDREIETRLDEIKSDMYKCTEENLYSDALARQLIHTIEVVSENTLLIKYHCGIESTQRIELKIRKLHSAA